ncbi:MAG: sigma-54 dependent transcriptional regulator [Cryomorphaceae bacterium]
MQSILIIDNDPQTCEILERFLARHGYSAESAYSLKKGLSLFKKKEHRMVLCGYRLSDGEGIEMIKRIKSIRAASNIIIMASYDDVRLAVRCIKQGASDYVVKPIQPDEILHSIRTAEEKQKDRSKPRPDRGGRPSIPQRGKPSNTRVYIDGISPQSRQVQKLIDLVGPTEMSVIVEGETGTGKEYAARRIHGKSARSNEAFIAIDCGALPNEIAGSELFGHKKGAFTGAVSDKVGAFEEADGGTLFLDEIANLDYSNQIQLLRVLQERKIKRIGDAKDRKVDVRLIAATNEDLWVKAQKGEFREDLYHRLCEFNIRLAPLRNRPIEIEQYAMHFLERANNELGKKIKGISKDGMQLLHEHRWDGNLRELRNAIKRAVLLTETDRLKPLDFPVVLSRHREDESGEVQFHGNFSSLKDAAESAERVVIVRALERTGYNKSKTASLLKVDRKTLYNKMKAYGIDF